MIGSNYVGGNGGNMDTYVDRSGFKWMSQM